MSVYGGKPKIGGMLDRVIALVWEGSAPHVDKQFLGPEVETVKSYWRKNSLWPKTWWFLNLGLCNEGLTSF